MSYEMKFPLGTWVKGKTTGSDKFEHGLLMGFDEGDGEHRVLFFPQGIEDWANFYANEFHGPWWCEPGDIIEDTPPEWLGGSAKHAFVYDWMDDHVPNVTLHAEPQDIVDSYFPDADEAELKKVQLKLMEAVADPGERVELAPGGGSVRFCLVNE